jgi:hypothetical protein
MLAFKLNYITQSHLGATMARAFQDMLKRFGLEKKILGFNADNATSNDTQTTNLATLDNSFNEVNRVRCFNHTIQLSGKELIKPFNAGITGKDTTVDDGDGDGDGDVDMPVLENPDDAEEEDADSDAESVDVLSDTDDADDGIDELEMMTEAEREEIVADTAIVRETVTKVCNRLRALLLYLT